MDRRSHFLPERRASLGRASRFLGASDGGGESSKRQGRPLACRLDRVARGLLPVLLALFGCQEPYAGRIDMDGDGYDARLDCDDGDPELQELTWYRDDDGDGFGDAEVLETVCRAPEGFVANADDCDDTNSGTYLGAKETCDEEDNNCDGEVDNEPVDSQTWYTDADEDSYGDTAAFVIGCEQPGGTVIDPGDCDDGNPDANPGITEETFCNGVDDDCNVETSDRLDEDGDGYDVCDFALNGAPNAQLDCNDGDPGVYPDAPEKCGDDISQSCGLRDPCTIAGTLELATTTHPGVTLSGDQALGWFGSAVSSAGDLDGDGLSDVLIGAPGEDGGAGAVYIYYGKDLASWNASVPPEEPPQAVRLTGEGGSAFGTSLAWLGDIDGDGCGDLLVGAPFASSVAGTATGAAYIIYGPFSQDIDVAESPQVTTELGGSSAQDQAGHAVASDATDISGARSLAVGAPRRYDEAGHDAPGGVYFLDLAEVAFEKRPGYLPLDSGPAVTLLGSSDGDYAGVTVSLGDIDGDSNSDIAVGASLFDVDSAQDTGAAYLVRDKGAEPLLLVTLDDSDARLEGSSSFNHTGAAVSLQGDYDGDGVKDVLVGAPDASASGQGNAGAVYTFSGTVSGVRSVSEAAYEIQGAENQGFVGHALCFAGDVNGDGADDLLIGAYGYQASAGAAGLFYGPLFHEGDPPRKLGFSEADALILGESPGGWAGEAVASAGDIDGDGYDDLLIGAPRESSRASEGGAVYILFGGGI